MKPRSGPSLLAYLVVCGTLAAGCSSNGVNPRLPVARTAGATHTAASVRWLEATEEAGFGSDFFILNLSLNSAHTELNVEGAEANPRTGELDHWEMVLDFQGAVAERIAMRHANEWYLAFRTGAGGVRIERWCLGHTLGAYYSTRPEPGCGVGTPVQTAALVVGIQGDRYEVPSGRATPEIAKTLVVANLALPPISHMVVDPDGRYLVMEIVPTTAARQLVQVALKPSLSPLLGVGEVIPLWDYSNIAAFPAAATVGQLEHPEKGRALVIRDLQTSLCLWDAENDGVFESSEPFHSLAEWSSKYPYMTWARSY